MGRRIVPAKEWPPILKNLDSSGLNLKEFSRKYNVPYYALYEAIRCPKNNTTSNSQHNISSNNINKSSNNIHKSSKFIKFEQTSDLPITIKYGEHVTITVTSKEMLSIVLNAIKEMNP